MRASTGESLSYSQVIRQWLGANTGEATGIGLVRHDGITALTPPFWEIGMSGVGLLIDPETGYVTVDQLVTVADFGFAINPRAVEGQALGAATQGIGMALHEELVYDRPQLVNPTSSTTGCRGSPTITAHRSHSGGARGRRGSLLRKGFRRGRPQSDLARAASAVARATGV
jgi:hypothetical protein